MKAIEKRMGSNEKKNREHNMIKIFKFAKQISKCSIGILKYFEKFDSLAKFGAGFSKRGGDLFEKFENENFVFGK